MKAEASIEKISVKDYLATERESDTKHEYIDGIIIPMSGSSIIHNTYYILLFAITLQLCFGS